MKHFLRFTHHLFVFIFFCVPMMIVGALILPIGILLAGRNIRLPRPFKWWDSVDDYLGRDTTVYRIVCDKGFWARYKWLAFRNPMNYADYMLLGMRWNGDEIFTRYNPDEDDIGDGTRPGFRHIEVKQGNIQRYEYYLIYRYPFAKRFCFRYRLGYKIKNKDNPKGSISQWVMVVSPMMPFTGK